MQSTEPANGPDPTAPPAHGDRRARAGPAALGRRGEDAAAAYVCRLGWTVVARNWRPRPSVARGELDLIAVDGATVVVCEVKTRSGVGAGVPAVAVTPAKVRRIRRLTGLWLAEHPTNGSVRIDVVGVIWPLSALAPTITHYRDVGF